MVAYPDVCLLVPPHATGMAAYRSALQELSRMKVDEAAMPIDSDGQPISLLGLNLRSSSSNG